MIQPLHEMPERLDSKGGGWEGRGDGRGLGRWRGSGCRLMLRLSAGCALRPHHSSAMLVSRYFSASLRVYNARKAGYPWDGG